MTDHTTADPFTPTPTDALLTFIAQAVLIIILIVLVGLLVYWLWSLRDRLPGRQSRLAVMLEQAEESLREQAGQIGEAKRAALRASQEAAAQVQAAMKQAELAHAEVDQAVAKAAAATAALSEMQSKALAMVKAAGMSEAAVAAEAKRLASDLQAANVQAAKLREFAIQADNRLTDLQARHDDTLADLRKLRDCEHPELATAYTRETDPTTGARPYRSAGLLCKRCSYVMPSAPTPEPVRVAEPAAPPLAAT